jgi:nicotinamide riboside kinase
MMQPAVKVLDLETGKSPTIKITITQLNEGVMTVVEPTDTPYEATGLMLMGAMLCAASRSGISQQRLAAWLRKAADAVEKISDEHYEGLQGQSMSRVA